MKKSAYVRFTLCLFLLISLVSPTAVLAVGDDGKKHFKEGLKAEVSEQWDKAVEEFALAVAATPKNPEYRLHYQRALFNASQMFMKRGTALATEKIMPVRISLFARRMLTTRLMNWRDPKWKE